VSATDEEAERLKIPARGGADDTDARTMSVIHQLPLSLVVDGIEQHARVLG